MSHKENLSAECVPLECCLVGLVKVLLAGGGGCKTQEAIYLDTRRGTLNDLIR